MNGATWPVQWKARVKEAERVGGGRVAEVAGQAFLSSSLWRVCRGPGLVLPADNFRPCPASGPHTPQEKRYTNLLAP